MACIFFLFFVIRSIKIQKLNYELKELTEIDSLTQLKNKRYIYNYLSRLVGTNQEVIVSVMDIDYFKLYNDNYGHIKGDYILKTVADIIHNSFKDDVVGRFGGEEFCVVSTRSYSQFKEDVIEFMMKLEKHNIKHEYSPIEKRITVSIGVERDVLRRQIHIDNLIEKSDKNMYISKINGRNKYTF
nr:GGDEF domain-containing protein [Clostridium sp. MSJ-8]